MDARLGAGPGGRIVDRAGGRIGKGAANQPATSYAKEAKTWEGIETLRLGIMEVPRAFVNKCFALLDPGDGRQLRTNGREPTARFPLTP